VFLICQGEPGGGRELGHPRSSRKGHDSKTRDWAFRCSDIFESSFKAQTWSLKVQRLFLRMFKGACGKRRGSAPEPPRATRSQPEPIQTGGQNVFFTKFRVEPAQPAEKTLMRRINPIFRKLWLWINYLVSTSLLVYIYTLNCDDCENYSCLHARSSCYWVLLLLGCC